MLILPTQQIQAYIMSEDEIMAYDAAKYARRVEAEPGDMPEDSVPALDDVDEELLVATRAAVEDDDEAAPNAGPVQANGITPKRRTITHTVASGETISDIAARYEVRVSDIRAWNSLRRNAVRTGQKLRIETSVANAAQQAAPAKTQKPGSANATPAKTTAKTPAKTTTKAPAKTTATKAAAAKPVTHTIKNGESLTTIAKKYGVTVDALRKANGMTGDAIRAGKTLKIPAKGAAASSGSKSKATSSKKKSSTKKKASKKR